MSAGHRCFFRIFTFFSFPFFFFLLEIPARVDFAGISAFV